MFCDYYSLVVCIYIFSCSFSFILNTKFVKKRPKIYFFLSAWENFWRHNGFPKRHSGAKAPLLLTLIVTDKYNFDFCFESRNFTSQAEGAACENVSKKRMRPPCAIVCFLVVASDTIIIRQDMAF